MVLFRALGSRSWLALGQLFHRMRQLYIERGDARRVMRHQVYDHLVPNIRPLGVMIHGLGDQRACSLGRSSYGLGKNALR